MFKKRKNKDPKIIVSIFNSDNELLFNGELNSVPIKETVIIKKSIEFFDDHNPCYIHRGAVTVRLLSEIEAYLKMHREEDFTVGRHNGSVVDYIDIDGIHRMEIS
ncbi:hypothetical protein [Ruminiclostridium cellulolyticum]|uniref:Uncharacterized protein n=1 Tax=Ruminiclostridium cellulolyticum (strain ATCC 35319 / DSM 5812 / JCM 6584 / H10) TaxID=394503 RepID=B8I9C0_RUMCH|nr:hypothetical protein [Ruminiclostridium cellulolyticum]ACL75380.1 hypothetical protein Ccel_1018 [Ruminiclostridium cellulolyticum H10]